ncbi:MAG: hypothetical protein NTU83_06655 [Candidatus Hydrogenedentes bacterium]|nr:hypothetical protein [Candidatus Hydrogenedentota bacterium]
MRAALWCCFGLAVLLVLLVVALGVVFRTAIYHRYVLFPKQAAAWTAIRAQRQPVTLDDGWKEFRGAMHSHSELSHDSKVSFPDILQALKKADVSFICMTDHPVDHKGDYSRGWKGIHDGILFVRGYEMDYGYMPWGIPDDTVLDDHEDAAVLAKRIHDLGGALFMGGVLFIAHSEEKRPWELPEIDGMEIYNIHSDLIMNGSLAKLVPDVLLSLWSYPDQTIRLIFHRPKEFLRHWDEMNIMRRMTGIAANDAHQNNGVRGVYTPAGTFEIFDTGHIDRPFKEFRLNGFTRLLLGTFFGPLEPGRQLFRLDIDPYERSTRFANTHLLMRELTEPAILDALRHSRAFVGFDMIADARGFKFLAESPKGKATIGESIALDPGLKLRMASPNACRFTVFRHGVQVAQQEGTTFDWTPPDTGKYRVEAELNIVGEWTPWVYTNPIEVLPAGTGGSDA